MRLVEVEDETDSSDDGCTSYVSEERDEMEGARDYACKGTRKVDLWRELVTGSLVIASCLISIAAFTVLSLLREGAFQNSFHQFAAAVEEGVKAPEKAINETFSNVGDLITAQALVEGVFWIFVTLPHFEILDGHARKSTSTIFFAFSPIVSDANMELWQQNSQENKNWILDSWSNASHENKKKLRRKLKEMQAISDIPLHIHRLGDEKLQEEIESDQAWRSLPLWQTSPPPAQNEIAEIINFEALSSKQLKKLFRDVTKLDDRVYSGCIDPNLYQDQQSVTQTHGDIQSVIFQPIYQTCNKRMDAVGVLQVVISWKEFVSQIYRGHSGFDSTFVLRNSCGEKYTYHVRSDPKAQFVGVSDLHDEFYNRYGMHIYLFGTTSSINENLRQGGLHGACAYTLHLYPTVKTAESFRSAMPKIFTSIAAASFVLMSFSFFIYDKYVRRRNEKMVAPAATSNAIISSLFLTNIRDRLLGHVSVCEAGCKRKWSLRPAGVSRLRSYLADDESYDYSDFMNVLDTKPIADLFPETTVMFADIVGFTAWSSVKEPAQVFILLDTIFRSFDEIAQRRRVFKVETVGDCYVAVTGLPEPRKDHATVMARYASECLAKMVESTKRLEVALGPDTADLSMRFGLHSGPVTAGVLRGQRSRFQLFGDTMNTAARIENTSSPGRIHISEETADLLVKDRKKHWFKPSVEKVVTKGKGELKTYWLLTKRPGSEYTSVGNEKSSEFSTNYMSSHPDRDKTKKLSGRIQRLIEWNVDLLQDLLKQVIARRHALKYRSSSKGVMKNLERECNTKRNDGHTLIDEIKEIIFLPEFKSKAAKNHEDPDSIQLDSAVTLQLHDYVTTIATMYRKNAFHCFEHASHVTMSVAKLLSQIVAPATIDRTDTPTTSAKNYQKKILSQLHDHTYGITSDPLTQFSVVLSALIHDVDHVGLPNATLVAENHHLAVAYKSKSVAEQNSIDLAWDLLMDSRYDELRSAIYCNDEEFKRFRELVVNTVLATDISDKELKELRHGRWEKAFDENTQEEQLVARNRRATIVIEYLIQASDVSHTMQHWHIYRKWNELFFRETYQAFLDGHSEKDPSELWFKGEIGFFDFHIIPLAKKLKECGVFGVSSDEYLNYATKNRREWELKGEGVVAEMVAAVKASRPAGSRESCDC